MKLTIDKIGRNRRIMAHGVYYSRGEEKALNVALTNARIEEHVRLGNLTVKTEKTDDDVPTARPPRKRKSTTGRKPSG